MKKEIGTFIVIISIIFIFCVLIYLCAEIINNSKKAIDYMKDNKTQEIDLKYGSYLKDRANQVCGNLGKYNKYNKLHFYPSIENKMIEIYNSSNKSWFPNQVIYENASVSSAQNEMSIVCKVPVILCDFGDILKMTDPYKPYFCYEGYFLIPITYPSWEEWYNTE